MSHEGDFFVMGAFRRYFGNTMSQAAVNQPVFAFALSDVVNVSSVPKRSVFRYPGGKTWLVPHVRRWLNWVGQGKHLIEPFAGGATVGLTAAFESLADKVTLVELDEDVAAVWKACFDAKSAKTLAQQILSFQMNLKNVRAALETRPRGVVQRAFQTLLRNRVQHGGIMAAGASLMKEGENGKGVGSRWYPATLAKRIGDIGTVSHCLQIIQGDAFGVIAEHANDSNAVFFVDPPYTVAGRRLYRHSVIDHEALFAALSKVSGHVLMTYDDTDEVRRWSETNGFCYKHVSMKSRQHTHKRELLISRSLEWID